MLPTIQRMRAGLLVALVVLVMLLSALSASADPGTVQPSNITPVSPSQPLNITWE